MSVKFCMAVNDDHLPRVMDLNPIWFNVKVDLFRNNHILWEADTCIISHSLKCKQKEQYESCKKYNIFNFKYSNQCNQNPMFLRAHGSRAMSSHSNEMFKNFNLWINQNRYISKYLSQILYYSDINIHLGLYLNQKWNILLF